MTAQLRYLNLLRDAWEVKLLHAKTNWYHHEASCTFLVRTCIDNSGIATLGPTVALAPPSIF